MIYLYLVRLSEYPPQTIYFVRPAPGDVLNERITEVAGREPLWQIAHGTPQVQMISAPQQILNLRVTPDQVGSVQERD